MSEENKQQAVTTYVCGPTSYPTCICNCPENCGHIWNGPTVVCGYGNSGEITSVTCSVCGMLAFEHDLWVMP